jgi:hypothetical protein
VGDARGVRLRQHRRGPGRGDGGEALGARGSAKLQSLELVDVDTLLGVLEA